ncbi:MAG: RNA polymerase sigma factor [Defluviitaleaceae bacterium]|nr:RNA polymerase sigma factor [Defluviitaleaceae bacterium]
MDDKKIIELYFGRDEAAIEQTRLKYGQRLFRSAMNVLHSREDAEEAVNDTLMKAWAVIPPTEPATLGAFLAKISRNIAINRLRAKSAARRGGGELDLMLSELEDVIPAATATTPEEKYEAKQLTGAINSCLAEIEITARVTFVLRYFHGESITAIAQRFNMKEGTVKSILFRTRKKLSNHLQKEGIQI